MLSAAGGEIPVDGSASDAATLTGVTGTAGGTVEYRLYGSLSACDGDVAAFPGTAPSGGTLVSTVTVTNGAAPSSAAHTFGAAGTFYWAAFYSGDANNRAAASDCATEPLVVTPAQSQVTTQLSATDGQTPVGGSVSDSATLHDVTGTAGGTVEYRYYGSQAACETDVAAFPGTAPSGGTPVSTETVTNGAVPRSSAVTFPAAGTVYWTAFYSGDAANLPAASDCATEPLVVTPAQSRVTTVLSAAGGQFGGRRVGERRRDADRGGRHRGRDRGVPVLRLAVRLRKRCCGVPAHRSVGRHPGVHGDGDQRRGAAVGGAHVPRRGHLLLGRVLLRRPQQPGGGQRLRHRAPGRHPGAIAGDHAAVGRRRGDSGRRAGERLRDAARGDRHRGRDRGVPLLRLAVRLPVRDRRVPAGRAAPWCRRRP